MFCKLSPKGPTRLDVAESKATRVRAQLASLHACDLGSELFLLGVCFCSARTFFCRFVCVCARVNQTDRFRLALRIPVLFGRGVHASPDPQVQCQGKTEPQEHLLRVPFPIRLPAIMKAPSTPFIDLALCKSDLFHVSLMEGTHQQDMLLTRGLFSVPRNLHGSQAFVLSFTDVQLEVHVCGYLRCWEICNKITTDGSLYALRGYSNRTEICVCRGTPFLDCFFAEPLLHSPRWTVVFCPQPLFCGYVAFTEPPP